MERKRSVRLRSGERNSEAWVQMLGKPLSERVSLQIT